MGPSLRIGMDPSAAFYQTLTGISFTLLGLWFGVMQFSHGGWRSDPERHRTTLHIAMHFFLPGILGLGSLLGGTSGSGLVWRVTFVVGGLVGVFESVAYLVGRTGLARPAMRVLRLTSPVLWAFIVIVALLPTKVLTLTSLQVEGMVVGLVFICGLCYVWLAFAERDLSSPTTQT